MIGSALSGELSYLQSSLLVIWANWYCLLSVLIVAYIGHWQAKSYHVYIQGCLRIAKKFIYRLIRDCACTLILLNPRTLFRLQMYSLLWFYNVYIP